MTDLSDYTTEQALARDLLIAAANSGSTHWARVHSLTVDCPPDQVRAEGIDTTDRSVWHIDLNDISRAITRLIQRPLDCGDPEFIRDTGLLTTVSQTLADAQSRHLARVADLSPGDVVTLGYARDNFEDMVTDVVLQVAIADEVIR